MSDNRGIFGLEEFYDRQVSNTITNILDPFIYDKSPAPVGTDFGYFMGGAVESYSPSANFSDVDRLDFSNDTADMVSKAFLPTGKGYMRGFSSLTHGYTSGGYAPAFSTRMSTIDRIDYANDTTAQTAKGPLEFGVSSNNVGLHNTEYGYTLGGSTSPSVTFTSYNQRLEFANDTTTTAPKGNLSQNKNYGAGAGNQSYGYYSGGGTPSRISSVERLDYSNDTTALAPKGPLSRIVNEHDAAGNADYGYHAGGWDPSSPYSNVTDRIDYSNDTAVALIKAILAYPGKHGPTTTGNTSYGYWTGGYGNTTNSYRLDYSSDTTQMSVKGKRTRFSQNGCGTSSRANAMPLTLTSGDTVRGTPVISGPSSGYAYYAGGSASGGSPTPIYGGTSTIDRVDFANDTATASVRCVMSLRREYSTATSSDDYGYVWGGLRPGYFQPDPRNLSSIERLDYASDTTNTAPRSKMPYPSYSGSGMGNSSYGYYGGGSVHADPSVPLLNSRIQRIDYASDTTDTVTRSYITSSPSYNSFVAGASNTNFGYITGRSSPKNSILNRLDFANDTNNTVQRGFMASDASNRVAAANANYGWFGSGSSPSTPNMSKRVERVDFANDTAIAQVRGDLSSPAYGTGASGNASFGYWGGGYDTSVVRRVDYSNDTSTGLRKGSLSRGYGPSGTGQQSYQLSAFSSQEQGRQTSTKPPRKRFIDLAPEVLSPNVGPAYGYAMGGRKTPGNTDMSITERIDFSNDTTSPSPKGYLASARYARDGNHGTKDYGYLTGGALYGYDFSPAGYANHVKSNTDRIDYSNDTANLLARGPLVEKVEQGGTALNPNYAWMAGGDGSGYGPFNDHVSTIQRFDYGNDTAVWTVRSSLPYEVFGTRATSSPSYGYYLGGHRTNATSPSTTYTNTLRLDFSNDTGGVTPKGTVNQPLSYPGGTLYAPSFAVTGNKDFGYLHGGSDGNYFSTSQRLDYSNDTAGTVVRGQALQTWRYSASGTGHPNSGYVIGGGTSTYVERVDYANDTTIIGFRAPITQARYSIASTSAQHFGLPSAAVEAPFQPPFPIPTEAPNTSTAYADYAYLVGGFRNPADIYAGRTDAHRYDFSNDTSNATIRATGSPSPGFRRGAGSGNANAGYHDGMNNGSANVFKIDYANDTANLAQKANHTWSPSHKDNTSATSNANYGYYGGNNWPTSTPKYPSTVDRYDFANDSFSAITPIQRFTNATAIGNQEYGYFAGGTMEDPSNNQIKVSNVTRIDYASDSELPRLKGNLATAFSNAGGNAAAGNKNYGYFGGGNTDSSPNISLVQRVDYANDTAAATPKGPLVVEVHRTGASSNLNFGYFFGGGTPSTPSSGPTGGLSTIHRITFANDTATSSPRADIANPLQQFSTSNASNYGLT